MGRLVLQHLLVLADSLAAILPALNEALLAAAGAAVAELAVPPAVERAEPDGAFLLHGTPLQVRCGNAGGPGRVCRSAPRCSRHRGAFFVPCNTKRVARKAG